MPRIRSGGPRRRAAAHAPGREYRRSDAAPWDRVEVGLVERDLAQVPERVGLRRLRRVLIVEPEQRALAVAHLEEAHHAALVGSMLALGQAALDRGHDAFGHHGSLE